MQKSISTPTQLRLWCSMNNLSSRFLTIIFTGETFNKQMKSCCQEAGTLNLVTVPTADTKATVSVTKKSSSLWMGYGYQVYVQTGHVLSKIIEILGGYCYKVCNHRTSHIIGYLIELEERPCFIAGLRMGLFALGIFSCILRIRPQHYSRVLP